MRPAIGFVSDRAGRRWVIVTGLTICSVAVFSLSFATTASAVVAAVIMYAAGVATTTAATSAFITDVTRRARYGAAHGVFGTIYDVGDALGPIVAGLLVVAVGYARMFQIMAAVALTMAVAFAVIGAFASQRSREAARGVLTSSSPWLERSTAMWMASLFGACLVVGMMLVVHGATRKVDFSDDAVGQAPKGFEFGHTAKAGAPGKWVVQAEGGNNCLAQLDPDNTRSRFPVAVVSDVTAADVDLSARFKPVSGRVDQAAGLVWRFQNEDNYYIVRANALENNVVLYKVEKGKRTDLPSRAKAGRTGRRRRSRRASGARCEWSRRGRASRCSSTAASCTRSRTPRSRSPARSASGRRRTRSRSLTT